MGLSEVSRTKFPREFAACQRVSKELDFSFDPQRVEAALQAVKSNEVDLAPLKGRRVVVVDDHSGVLADSIRHLVAATDDNASFIIVRPDMFKSSAPLVELAQLIVATKAEFALLDYDLKLHFTGDQLIPALKELDPSLKCVGFSSEFHEPFINAGALGAVRKSLGNILPSFVAFARLVKERGL